LVEPPRDQRRVIAAFGYVFPPVVPAIVLGSETMKDDPYLRRHAGQALLWTPLLLALLVLVVMLMVVLIRWSFIGFCLLPIVMLLPFAPGIWWGYRVYEHGDVTVPGISHLAARLFPPRSR
jgi:hypothetical protein